MVLFKKLSLVVDFLGRLVVFFRVMLRFFFSLLSLVFKEIVIVGFRVSILGIVIFVGENLKIGIFCDKVVLFNIVFCVFRVIMVVVVSLLDKEIFMLVLDSLNVLVVNFVLMSNDLVVK